MTTGRWLPASTILKTACLLIVAAVLLPFGSSVDIFHSLKVITSDADDDALAGSHPRLEPKSHSEHTAASVVGVSLCRGNTRSDPWNYSTRGRFVDEFDSGNEGSGTRSPFVTKEGVEAFLSNNLKHAGAEKDSPFPAAFDWEVTNLQQPTRQLRNGDHHEDSRGKESATFVSTFRRASRDRHSPHCYYLLRSACLVDGQLVLLENESSATTTTSGSMMENSTWVSVGSRWASGKAPGDVSFRLCNELRRKINFRAAQKRWSEIKPKILMNSPRRSRQRDKSGEREVDWRPYGHVLACWQLYGFHLVECLASAYSMQVRFGMRNVDVILFNHGVSLSRESSQHFSHATFMGSNTSFDDPVSPLATELGYSPAPFWGMFAQNTLSPSDVVEVQRGAFPHGTTRCYQQLLVGQQDPRNLTNQERRHHAKRLRSVLLGAHHTSDEMSRLRFCSSGRAQVTVVQRGAGGSGVQQGTEVTGASSSPHAGGAGSHRTFRDVAGGKTLKKENLQGRRSFANATHVAEVISSVSLPIGAPLHCVLGSQKSCDGDQRDGDGEVVGTEVRIVDWAAISLRRQAAVAASTNILVATHGAGNVWLALMPPRSVVIEVWPECIGRNVYVSLAKQHNIRYIPLCHPSQPQHPSSTVLDSVQHQESDSFDVVSPNVSSSTGNEKKKKRNRNNNVKKNFMTDDVEVDRLLLHGAVSAALRFLLLSYGCCE